MKVHKIDNPNQLPKNLTSRGYTGTNLSEAIQLYFRRYQVTPEEAYILENKRSQAIYLKVPEEK